MSSYHIAKNIEDLKSHTPNLRSYNLLRTARKALKERGKGYSIYKVTSYKNGWVENFEKV